MYIYLVYGVRCTGTLYNNDNSVTSEKNGYKARNEKLKRQPLIEQSRSSTVSTVYCPLRVSVLFI